MKYRVLRIISTVFKVLGWVVLVLGLLSTCGFSLMVALGGSIGSLGGDEASALAGLGTIVMAVVMFLGGLVGTVLASICYFAVGELIQVVLDIEANTRAMVEGLRRGA